MNTSSLIKQSIPLRTVMEFYGINFNGRGFALCPFHADKHPSLSIKNDRYTCFSCGAHGDVFDFMGAHFGLTYPESIARLNADFALGIYDSRPNPESAEAIRKRKAQKEAERIERERAKAVYIAVAESYAKLMRWGYGRRELERMSLWLDENIGVMGR